MASATLARPASGPWSQRRVWHPVPRRPLPAEEAGRAHIVALLNGPDGPRADLRTSGDDRAETSLKAIYRHLWRLGHAQRSGAYATTQDQLVDALMPIMGWPDRGSVLDNRSAHGRTVRRWLDRLQAMGLLRWSGVRDNCGRWWRVELELLRPPAPDAAALRAARRRTRGFSARERRRRAANPTRRRDLGRVLDRSGRPSTPARRRVARARARVICSARRGRRDAAVREENVRSNPYGAPPTVGDVNTSSSATSCSPSSSEQRTGAREPSLAEQRQTPGHAPPGPDDQLRLSSPANGQVGIENETRPSGGTQGPAVDDGPLVDPPAGGWEDPADADLLDPEAIRARIAARQAAIDAGRTAPTAWHVVAATKRRAFDALTVWPADRPIPDRLLAEAFEHATGSASACLARDRRHRPALDRALARYARYVDHRPAGWPASPAAALARAMEQLADHVAHDGQRPASLAYAVGRLNIIAKQMAADARRAQIDAELDARRRRLQRRQRRQDQNKLPFRQRAPLRWADTTETHRRAAIDAALKGQLPGFEALHGFLIRAADLIGRPNPRRRLTDGQLAYDEALRALRHVDNYRPSNPPEGAPNHRSDGHADASEHRDQRSPSRVDRVDDVPPPADPHR